MFSFKTDACWVKFNFHKSFVVDIPATFFCYVVLERAFNQAYNYDLDHKKSLGWFLNDVFKKRSLSFLKITTILNLLLSDYLKSDFKLKYSFFKRKRFNNLFNNLIELTSLCLFGSAEGQKIMQITAPKSCYGQKAKKKGDFIPSEFLIMDWLYIAKWQYFALTKLNVSSKEFWYMTIDRMFVLYSCFAQEQKDIERQSKSGDAVPLDEDSARSLKEFINSNNVIKM